MKLISMTDFVLEQNNKTIPAICFKDCVLNYAKFLKQSLELWMFVPCDEDGDVLVEPERYRHQLNFDEWEDRYDKKEVLEFQQAKERVLFEGFKIIFYDDKPHALDHVNGSLFISQLTNVDSLLHLKPTLTKTAIIKQVGL